MSSAPSLSDGAQRILATAGPLFATKGFAAVSVNDIAEAAGTSKANVYHHFPNKETLYLAAIGCACVTFRKELEKLTKSSEERHRLRAIASGHLARMLTDPDSVRLILREVFAGDKGHDRAQIAGILHRNFALLVEEIGAGQGAGWVSTDVDPVMVALTIIALNTFLFQSWNILERFDEFSGYETPQECLDALFGTLGKGLVPA